MTVEGIVYTRKERNDSRACESTLIAASKGLQLFLATNHASHLRLGLETARRFFFIIEDAPLCLEIFFGSSNFYECFSELTNKY